VLADSSFRKNVEGLIKTRRQALEAPAWFQQNHSQSSLTRDKSGIPTEWVKRMRESMARLTPRFSANRTVREYTEQHYLPAAAAYRLRVANKGSIGRQIVDWQQSLEQKWGTLRFGEVKVETSGEQQVQRYGFHGLSFAEVSRCSRPFRPKLPTALIFVTHPDDQVNCRRAAVAAVAGTRAERH
jgi:hypothetical protein